MLDGRPVWIDLANSPHVLFFAPVIAELHRRGVATVVTARDFAQTVPLCERLGIGAEVVGRHGGGSLAGKARSLAARVARAAPLRRAHASGARGQSQLLRAGRGRTLAAHTRHDRHGLRVPARQPPGLPLRRPRGGTRRVSARSAAGAGCAAGEDVALRRPQGAHRPRRIHARAGLSGGQRRRRRSSRDRRPAPGRHGALSPLREPALRAPAAAPAARPTTCAPSCSRARRSRPRRCGRRVSTTCSGRGRRSTAGSSSPAPTPW